MFKLVKILNSVTNAPEMMIKIPCGTDTATTWTEGTAVVVSNAVLTKANSVKPEYIVAYTTKTQAATDVVVCYKILPGMIFDTYCIMSDRFKPGLRTSVMVGTMVGYVANVENNGPIVVDMLGHENDAGGSRPHLLVQFDKL